MRSHNVKQPQLQRACNDKHMLKQDRPQTLNYSSPVSTLNFSSPLPRQVPCLPLGGMSPVPHLLLALGLQLVQVMLLPGLLLEMGLPRMGVKSVQPWMPYACRQQVRRLQA